MERSRVSAIDDRGASECTESRRNDVIVSAGAIPSAATRLLDPRPWRADNPTLINLAHANYHPFFSLFQSARGTASTGYRRKYCTFSFISPTFMLIVSGRNVSYSASGFVDFAKDGDFFHEMALDVGDARLRNRFNEN